MDRVVATGKYLGLMLQRPKGISLTVAKKHWKAELTKEGVFPMTIVMPCGNQVTYSTFEDIPDTNVPCPCGDKSHWVVEYSVVGGK